MSAALAPPSFVREYSPVERCALFAANLRYFRLRSGLTQRELADRAHVGRKSVEAWERELRTPGIQVVFQLAEALQVPPWRLLCDQSEWLEMRT